MTDAATLTFVVDGLIVALLAATIGYAVVLNRKLSALRDAKAEMDVLAERLAESVQTARSGLDALMRLAEESGADLQRTTGSARSLADDLVFLIERGNALADRMDGAIGAARSEAPSAAPMNGNVNGGVNGNANGHDHGKGNAKGTGSARQTGEAELRPAPAKWRPTAPQVSPEEAKLRQALQGVR